VTEKRKSYRNDLASNLAGSDPLLVPIKQASAIIAKCPRGIYALMATGELQAVKSGRSTLIKYESIIEYVEKLPSAKIKPHMRKQ
jgi:Helix-turn-helix domain